MKKYEYCILTVKGKLSSSMYHGNGEVSFSPSNYKYTNSKERNIVMMLNTVGNEGWELVKIEGDLYYFKREKIELEPKKELLFNDEKELLFNEEKEDDFQKAKKLINTIAVNYPQIKNSSKAKECYENIQYQLITYDEFEKEINNIVKIIHEKNNNN